MPNIEINTTQNVRITYEVAHLGDRALAFLIDLLILGGLFVAASLVSGLFVGHGTSWLFYLVAVPPAMFYTLGSEVLMKGQTLGKRALSIQVVKLNGTEAKVGDYFLRWIFRPLDIHLCMGVIASIFVISSKKGQRLGDLITETSVIRIKPSSRMTLLDLQKRFHEQEHYEPQFPQVKKLSESDMLFIQGVILRYQSHPNQAHSDVLSGLCQKLETRLEVGDHPQTSTEQVKWLTILIKDYIFLTR